MRAVTGTVLERSQIRNRAATTNTLEVDESFIDGEPQLRESPCRPHSLESFDRIYEELQLVIPGGGVPRVEF